MAAANNVTFVRKIALGSGTHYATGVILTSLCGQLGFLLNLGLRQKEKKDEKPVQDAALAEMFGDNGLPKPTVYDVDALCEGMACAYVAAVRHVRKPDPRTGRVVEKMAEYLTEPRHWIQRSAEFEIGARVTRIRATAEMLAKDGKPADAEKAIASAKAEVQAKADALIKPISLAFLQFCKTHMDDSTEALVDDAIAAFTLHGRNVRAEMRETAKRILDSQRKRFNEGRGYVEVDPTIWALAQDSDPVEAPVEPTPATETAPTPAAA